MMNCKIDLHCELCDGDCENYQEMVPVVEGYWYTVENPFDYGKSYECSVCRKAVRTNAYPYCPWCGAKMEGVLGE